MKPILRIVLTAVLTCTAVAGTAVSVLAGEIVDPAPTPPPASVTPPDAAGPVDTQPPCNTSWTAKDYKTFHNIQAEVKSSLGDVRILRVTLCGEGQEAYFRVIVMSGKGAVSRVHINAANPPAKQ